MEKGRGKGTDTLQTDNVFTHKEYIEREAAIVKLCQISDATSHDYAAGISVAVDAIDLLPAADVVPVRHGKWETAFLAHEYLGCRPYAHYCSVCHQIIAFRTFYCPNCGARMDGDSDGV